MNTTKIKELSKQCCDLQRFKDRCIWQDADFSVGDCTLDSSTSTLINLDIQIVVEKRIKLLKEEIKTEVGK